MIIITLILTSIKLFFFITPLVGLIASSIFLDYKSTLKISLILLLCQFISIFIESLFKLLSGSTSTINGFIKFIIDIPILILSLYYLYPIIPDYIIDFYYYCFQWIFPLLVYTIESYQLILLIVYKTRNNIIVSETNDLIYKSLVIIVSIISYLLSFFIIYQIFKFNEISTLNSCLLSSLGTLMILLIPYMIMVEESVISDISIITVVICLNLYSFFFQFDTSSILNVVNVLKSISYLITFLLISYPIITKNVYGDYDDDNYVDSSDNDDENILFKLKSKIIHIGLVIGLTYLPLSMTGIISNNNLVFRYLQGVFTVLCYFNLLSYSSQNDTFKFKYD